jgi:hypothetical protein
LSWAKVDEWFIWGTARLCIKGVRCSSILTLFVEYERLRSPHSAIKQAKMVMLSFLVLLFLVKGDFSVLASKFVIHLLYAC